jgi:putative ABC transport system permease protein
MKLLDSIEYSIKNLRTRSLRSWLTIIGIVIGVIAMVVITSVTEGVNRDITDLLSSFGPDKMFVIPINIGEGGEGFGAFTGGPVQSALGKLYQRDVDDIESVPGVDETARIVFGRATLEFRSKQLSSMLYATDENMFPMFGDYLELEKGRLFTDTERRVMVLGNDAANQLFGKDKLDVGSVVVVNGKDYRVIGVFKEIGHALATADDSNIYIPFEDGRDLFEEQLAKDEVGFVYIDLSEGFDAQEVKDLIERKIANNHKVTLDEKDFSVITADFINETVGAILGTLSSLLIAITAVATVVGGIGISNTMFMAVMERVREIGVLKSIGATRNDIRLIFLTESALLGLVGGIIGFVIAVLILNVAVEFGVPYLIQLRWIIFTFVFSAGIGVVAGFIPANNAAKLDPVEALRQL